MSDEVARRFAAGFYRGLGFGQSVQTAFELGRNELAMRFAAEKSIPQLLVQPGVDASTLRLI
ncbi:MAG: hypothetical protein H0T73_07985 [Ardenticatenales bacterium]|nr:hypothetical protein [Ardenticatenales bacterium]